VDRNSLAASEDEAYRSWLLEAIMASGVEQLADRWTATEGNTTET